MSAKPRTAGNRKTFWVGVLCLIFAFFLTWLSPRGGMVNFFEIGSGDEEPVLGVTKREREEVRYETSITEQYMRMARKGMGVKEARWVVEDFISLGLDKEYPVEHTAQGYLGLRKKREDWYLATLVSGFRLTQEQERQAAESMRVLREKDFAEFLKYLEEVQSFEHEGKLMKIFDGGKARKLMDASSWLIPNYMPSALCELSEEQKDLILNFHEETVNVPVEDGDISRDKLVKYSIYQPLVFYIFPPTEGQLRKHEDSDVTDSWLINGCSLSEAMYLQPDQLRIHLMTNPSLSGGLLKEIEAAGRD
jgi:hypothetical protein